MIGIITPELYDETELEDIGQKGQKGQKNGKDK